LGVSNGSDVLAWRSGVPDDYRFARADLDVDTQVMPETTVRLRMASQ
jgi:hypothetical protein